MSRILLSRFVAALALLVTLSVVPVSVAQAQTIPKAAPKTSVTDIEDEVMCVVCGRPLSTSSGTAADDERAVIQGYIDQGLTKPQVKEQLVGEFGKQVLVDNGSTVAAAVPIIAAIVGAGSIGLLLRRRLATPRDGTDDPGSSGPAGPTPPAAPTAADDARIDAELSERA